MLQKPVLSADYPTSFKSYFCMYIYIFFPENEVFCLPSSTICHIVDIHRFSLPISQTASFKAVSLIKFWHFILASLDVCSSSNVPHGSLWQKLPVTTAVQKQFCQIRMTEFIRQYNLKCRIFNSFNARIENLVLTHLFSELILGFDSYAEPSKLIFYLQIGAGSNFLSKFYLLKI